MRVMRYKHESHSACICVCVRACVRAFVCPQLIQSAHDGAAAKAGLVATLGLTERQADGLLGLTLRRLTGLEAVALQAEAATLKTR